MSRRVWWWACDRCAWRTVMHSHIGAAEWDRDQHIKGCQPWANRAPWERNISTDTLTFDA